MTGMTDTGSHLQLGLQRVHTSNRFYGRRTDYWNHEPSECICPQHTHDPLVHVLLGGGEEVKKERQRGRQRK